jgi:predicted MPP superfamily phosphohydrolase
MSHDPTHWEDQVMSRERIHLTLSGHTHGAQMGLEAPMLNIKFSPSPWFGYKRWAGLYEEAGQYLYVNRGFGFLGFPGRVGMPPEITFIELSAGNMA